MSTFAQLLDADLTIRLFTPATKRLFNVIPEDIGRPLTDLSSIGSEAALVSGARKVLQSLEPIEREIEALSGAWYVRRILPYRPEGQIEGITPARILPLISELVGALSRATARRS